MIFRRSRAALLAASILSVTDAEVRVIEGHFAEGLDAIFGPRGFF